jgi:transcriptional regulator with XRE-family HTH domain
MGMNQQQAASFGGLLSRHRRRAGLTQEELAEQAGVSVPTIGNLERGGYPPRRSTVDMLVTALHLPAGEADELRTAARRMRADDEADDAPEPLGSVLRPAEPAAVNGRVPDASTGPPASPPPATDAQPGVAHGRPHRWLAGAWPGRLLWVGGGFALGALCTTGVFLLVLPQIATSPVAGCSTVAANGQPRTGSIRAVGQADCYVLTVASAQTISVKVTATTGTLRPRIRVYSSDGRERCQEVALMEVPTEIRRCILPLAGSYKISVDDFGNGTPRTGAYALTLDLIS